MRTTSIYKKNIPPSCPVTDGTTKVQEIWGEVFFRNPKPISQSLQIYKALSPKCGGIRSLGVGWSYCAGDHPECSTSEKPLKS